MEDLQKHNHKHRAVNAPISPERLDSILQKMRLDQVQAVVDLGCGTGHWLLAALAASTSLGTGVDTDALALAEAGRRAGQRGLAERVVWLHEEAQPFVSAHPAEFDRVFCVGASHAFTGKVGALNELIRACQPGGMVLWGEGFWEREPAAEYLEFLGDDSLGSHHGNVQLARTAGFETLWATTAGLDEWDAFEWDFYRVTCDFLRGREEAAAVARRERAQRWLDGYLRWGRGTMGFGYYLLQRPDGRGDGARSGRRF